MPVRSVIGLSVQLSESSGQEEEVKKSQVKGVGDSRYLGQIDEDATFKTGHVVPDNDFTMIGSDSVIGRRTYRQSGKDWP